MNEFPRSRTLLTLLLAAALPAAAQLSSSAYRVLGQSDLRQNGVNEVQGAELGQPLGIALDTSSSTVHIYVTDTGNHRVLAWKDVRTVQNGDPATLVLGQRTPQNSAAYGIGAKGFNSPTGLAVDPLKGNLYVADFGNSRILRFPKPFANTTIVEPDAVYGQPDFNTFSSNSSGVTDHTLSNPRAVAFDSAGNLWVADSNNHRILRFPAALLDTANPSADLVIGQPDFHSAGNNHGAPVSATGFDSPRGMVFDAHDNLYVADFNNTRVLRFAAPLAANAAATLVLGEADFTSRGFPQVASASTLAGPSGVSLDSSGNLFVAVPFDNRIVMFPADATSGAAATIPFGQTNFTTTTPDTGVFPQASDHTFFAPSDVKVDPLGNLYVADTGNNRIVALPHNTQNASRVYGQSDFVSNGFNRIKPGSINAPYKMVVDYSQSPFTLYVSDTANNRVLIWRDAARFPSGAPADLVIGQPSLTTAIANSDSGGGTTPSRTSLAGPRGVAVDSAGNLYVADTLNNRVLRYPRPVAQQGRITPDIVLGQADFVSSASASVSAASLHRPTAVAIGSGGHVFVADALNNRVLEFPNGSTSGVTALRVYGQPAFNVGSVASTISAQTLSAPAGLYVDASSVLYVADAGNNRVLIYPDTKDAPAVGQAASIVLGQTGFNTSNAGGGPTGLHQPADVSLDSKGAVFVSDNNNHRVLIFPSLLSLLIGNRAATAVVGQHDLFGSQPNWNTPDGLATPEGLAVPAGIFVDRRDTLYVGDTGNNRVLHFLKAAVAINAASSQIGPVGQGAWTALYTQAADTTAGPAPAPLPAQLGSRQVVINDTIPAPLWFVSPAQINFIFPTSAPPGTQRIAVRAADTAELIAGGTVSVAQYSPGFFTATQDGSGQARALNQDNSLNGPDHPAARGTVLQLFGTGPGPYVQAVPDGSAAPGSLISTVATTASDAGPCITGNTVCVAVGSSLAKVTFSGLAPGLIGVWQVNVEIPADSLTGPAIPVRVLVHQTPSNAFTVAIN